MYVYTSLSLYIYIYIYTYIYIYIYIYIIRSCRHHFPGSTSQLDRRQTRPAVEGSIIINNDSIIVTMITIDITIIIIIIIE